MPDFTPIHGDATSWQRDDDVRTLDENQQELLVGHKVTKVDGEHLQLDNGTVIKAIGHDGGCSCSAGCYDLSVLNGVDNIITRVDYDYAPAGDFDTPPRSGHPDDPTDGYTGYYRIFVQFDGSDRNGYYGTGFEILVRDARA